MFLKLFEAEVFLRDRSQVVSLLFLEGIRIDLVEQHDHRLVGSFDIGKCLLYNVDLFLMSWMADVGHMDQNVGLPDLVEGRFE